MNLAFKKKTDERPHSFTVREIVLAVKVSKICF